MNGTNRLPLVGLVVMIIVAVFALALQQSAVNDLRTQMTRAAQSDSDKGTAVAMAQAASGTQAQAEVGQSTALAAAQGAGTAQATAQSAARTAAALVNDAGTRSAEFASTSTANSEAMRVTVTMNAYIVATLQAESTAEVATLQGQLAEQSTQQADTAAQLGTATAQVDLAEFARKAAEDDRTSALNQLWAMGTRQAESSSQLATAQALLTNAPPVTNAPSATSTPEPPATTVNNSTEPTATSGSTTSSGPASNGPLAQTFTSTDKKVQVSYPDGWFVQETQSGTIVIVNDESMFTRTSNKITTGQVEVDVVAGTYTQFNLTPGTTPDELIKLITDNIKSQQPAYKVSEPASITIGDYPAVQVLVDDGVNDLSINVLQLTKNAVALIYGLSAKGEGAAHMDQVLTIAASVIYTE
jgi:hypothetical protein